MHLSKLITTVASVAGIAATFLPWKTQSLLGEVLVTSGKDTPVILTSMQAGDGWITFVVFLLLLIVTFSGYRNTAIKGGRKIMMLVLSIIAAGISIYDINKVRSVPVSGELDGLATTSLAGYGLYVVLSSSIVIFFAAAFSSKMRPLGKFN
jgi:hypothetical protein